MEDNIKNKIENICNDFLKQFADENDFKLNDIVDVREVVYADDCPIVFFEIDNII